MPESKWEQKLAKFYTKEKKPVNSLYFPIAQRWHCPQNCKKEIRRLEKSLTMPESEGSRWVGISHRQYQTLGACGLAENGHCGTNLQCTARHQFDMRRPEMAGLEGGACEISNLSSHPFA